MVSHLTITPSTASGAPARAFNAQAGDGEAGAVDNTFAALLGNMVKADKSARSGMAGMIDAALESLSKLTKVSDSETETETKDEQTADPQAVAAVVDAQVPIKGDIDAKTVLTNLVKDLSTLKQSLDAGAPVDPELLKRVDAALDALGAKFDINLSADIGNAADDDALKALIAATATDTTPKAEVTKSVAPLVEALRAAAAPAATQDAAAQTVLPGELKAVSNKLQALLQALNGKADKPVDLAALGLAENATPDTDLTAALAKLSATSVKTDAAPAEPTLATPSLKLTDPTLTGKTEAESAPTTTTAETTERTSAKPVVAADAGGKPDSNADKGNDTPDKSDKLADAKLSDTKTSAAPAAPVVNDRTDAQPPAASQPVQVARVDAVAPRVIQAGYQTSQQQLNLPQIAFELVRQVNDGNARFQMRLDPPELGRIDVKLDIGASGHVKAHLIVDKAETLDLMQRDQRALERALQQAGLDSSKTNLEFSMRQNPFSGGQQQGRDQQGNPFGFQANTGEAVEEAPPTINLYRASLSASGVNIIA